MLARKSAIKFEYLNLDAAQRIACKSKASGDFKNDYTARRTAIIKFKAEAGTL
ncbi:hypothetical protein [uncultured Campylobacter sp.]|uniref:hypothetical protein n=1 Tax=uncultured Campylobacter sp. TaxID=218934 RepID=UPI00262052F8|nr:hypothetical protein [uncultured Campylobacter sp.]